MGLIGGNTSGTPTPAPDIPPPPPALGQLGNPNNPDVDPGYQGPTTPPPEEMIRHGAIRLFGFDNQGNPITDLKQYQNAYQNGLVTQSYAKGGSIQAMKQELASKKAAGGTIKDYIRVTERPL
jgi:hypothetical protein